MIFTFILMSEHASGERIEVAALPNGFLFGHIAGAFSNCAALYF